MAPLSQQSEDERRIVEAIRSGTAEVLADLYEEHYADLYRFARSIIGDSADAESLVQDVFCEIWSRRAQWAPGGPLRPYLFGTLRNHSLKHLRRRRLERRWFVPAQAAAIVQDQDGETAEDEVLRQELVDVVRAAAAQMPERRREIFLLSRQHGLSYREIAESLGLSVKTVETQMGRALRFLREHVSRLLL